MVRYEDPPGSDKHLRFGHFDTRGWLSDFLRAYKSDNPVYGVGAIVSHRRGKKGEHPHIHVWYHSDKPLTNQTVRDRLKKADARFGEQMKGQNDWSFRNHDNYEQWCDYVTRNVTHEVIFGDEYLVNLSKTKKDSYTTDTTNDIVDVSGVVYNIPSGLKRNKREQFVKYLIEEHGWMPEETNPTAHQVATLATRCWKGAFTDPEAIRMTRYAYYVFSDEDKQRAMESSLADRICSQIF